MITSKSDDVRNVMKYWWLLYVSNIDLLRRVTLRPTPSQSTVGMVRKRRKLKLTNERVGIWGKSENGIVPKLRLLQKVRSERMGILKI